MADTIKSTSNYDMFLLHEFNRDIGKTGKLEESMKKHGWIGAYPMHVTKDGNKLKIKAGHHRFTVARKLSIPVKYVVCDDSNEVSIHELEAATNNWKLKDYLMSFSRLENKAYKDVLEYHKRTGIGIAQCISLLAGSQASSQNHLHKFKNGQYKLGDPKLALYVADIICRLSSAGITISTSKQFVNAVSRSVFVKGFSCSRFITKALNNASRMTKRANMQQYMELIEEIYNFGAGSKNRLPIVFLANEAAMDRNVVKK